jgi:ataxin-3
MGGNMCALHAINSLLQGAYFTATVLANIGYELDSQEMALIESPSTEGHGIADDYNSWSNFDPTGNYSIQVITVALSYFQLELIPLNSSNPRAISSRQCTCNEQAFLCHKNNHWFTLRKFGTRWFNLNSLYPGPEEVHHDGIQLSLFATKESIEDFTGIFIVNGNLERMVMYRIPQYSSEEGYGDEDDNDRNKTTEESESKLSQLLSYIHNLLN